MRILALLMLLWTTASFAEHNGIQPDTKELPIQCGDTEHLLEGLNKTYEEEIVMMSAGVNARGHELYHSLWINAGTQTWTFLVVNKDMGVSCVISSGDNLQMFFPGSGI